MSKIQLIKLSDGTAKATVSGYYGIATVSDSIKPFKRDGVTWYRVVKKGISMEEYNSRYVVKVGYEVENEM